jgi:hypothetical protein
VTERDKLIKIAKNEMASANRGNTLIEPHRTLQIDSIEISLRSVFFFSIFEMPSRKYTLFTLFFCHLNKKYRGHRVLPETLMKDMEDAGMNN